MVGGVAKKLEFALDLDITLRCTMLASGDRLFEAMLENMPEEMKKTVIREFGSVEKWREHYLDAVGKENVQKQYAKVVEWYGGKDVYANSVKNPLSKEIRWQG
jgi:hypothetical protein